MIFLVDNNKILFFTFITLIAIIFQKAGKLFPEILHWTMNLVLLKAAWSRKFFDTGIILQDYSDTFTAC